MEGHQQYLSCIDDSQDVQSQLTVDRESRRHEQSQQLLDNLAKLKELEEQKRELEAVVNSYRQ